MTWGDLYKLSKGKLSLIVVTTAAAGFAAASGDRIDAPQLLYTCVGTFGCSAAANALNQVYEIRNDGLMRRTMLRPLPAGRMSAAQALLFAAVMGVGGAGLLAWQVRPAILPHCLPFHPVASARMHRKALLSHRTPSDHSVAERARPFCLAATMQEQANKLT